MPSNVSTKSGEDHGPSAPRERDVRLVDALIAATAIEHKLPVVTSNIKHSQSVKTRRIEAFKLH